MACIADYLPREIALRLQIMSARTREGSERQARETERLAALAVNTTANDELVTWGARAKGNERQGRAQVWPPGAHERGDWRFTEPREEALRPVALKHGRLLPR